MIWYSVFENICTVYTVSPRKATNPKNKHTRNIESIANACSTELVIEINIKYNKVWTIALTNRNTTTLYHMFHLSKRDAAIRGQHLNEFEVIDYLLEFGATAYHLSAFHHRAQLSSSTTSEKGLFARMIGKGRRI